MAYIVGITIANVAALCAFKGGGLSSSSQLASCAFVTSTNSKGVNHICSRWAPLFYPAIAVNSVP